MISYRNLVKNKEYSVKSPDGIFKRMIFIDYDASYNFGVNDDFAMDTYGTFIDYHNKNHAYYFRGRYLFYDPEEIKKNAQKARQTMEHRTVNMILKKLINEEFQW